MPFTPQAAIATNQTIITGPKRLPTLADPIRCEANRITMITAVIGTIRSSSDGWTTLSPSTADSTEIAGVIMLSPKNSDAPKIPNAASASLVRRPPRTPRRRISVISARMPPSPSLSARITSSTYLIVTMIVTDQKINEMTPYTLSSVAGTGCGSSGLKTVCTV